MAQYFNAVAYIFKRQGKDADGKSVIERRAMFDGPAQYICKACHPLTGLMEPQVDEWFRMLTSSETNTAASAAQEQ